MPEAAVKPKPQPIDAVQERPGRTEARPNKVRNKQKIGHHNVRTGGLGQARKYRVLIHKVLASSYQRSNPQ